MGIQDLQALLENEGVSVDLFRISSNHAGGLRLVLDAEGCLDRLYGGFYSDWACGGQWARCVQFLQTLSLALVEKGVSLAICFDGTQSSPESQSTAGTTSALGLPVVPSAPYRWVQQQAAYRQRINNVFRHIATRGTPPPKVWWVPPAGLHSCLRVALRYLGIPTLVTTEDHQQEVVAFCRDRGCAGILGNSGEYLAFQPPRYFSSAQFKLTYRSSLETKEFMVHDLPQRLDIPADRLSVLAALLGGHIILDYHLNDFYKRIGLPKKAQPDAILKAVSTYVKEMHEADVDSVCADIFPQDDMRSAKLRQAILYYQNYTKEGYYKFRSTVALTARKPKPNKKVVQKQSNQHSDVEHEKLDTSKFATDNLEIEAFEEYKNATANTTINSDLEGNVLDNPRASTSSASNNLLAGITSLMKNVTLKDDPVEEIIPIEVIRTCADRVGQGLMCPALQGILAKKSILLQSVLEDENHRELPPLHRFFRPIRQNVYAILYNIHHQNYMKQKNANEGEKVVPATVQIAEWIYTRQNPGKVPEMVSCVMLDWPVPTAQRLWFGTAQDDKRRRLRAYLSCMRSDSPLMLNVSYVPQHFLLLATVLRYIMSSPVQILRRQELDAFLATAFSPDLMNPLHLQRMTLSAVRERGVQLSALLMTGIEAALLANDACGAPVPWLVTAPWLYFDGKVFQRKLERALQCKHLVQLCDNQVEVVIKVERMRKAILEGLNVEFALPPIPLSAGMLGMGPPPPGAAWAMNTAMGGAMGGAGLGGRARLEIAGVVVGRWDDGSYRRPGMSYQPTGRASYRVGRAGPSASVAGQATGARRGRRGGRQPSSRVPTRTPRPPRNNRTKPRTQRPRPQGASLNGKSDDDSKPSSNGLSDQANVDTADDNSLDNDDNGSKEGSASEQSQNKEKGNGKGLKKNTNNKNKKKGGVQKTECGASLVDETTDASKKTKMLSKQILLNGSNGDHKGQGDSPVNN